MTPGDRHTATNNTVKLEEILPVMKSVEEKAEWWRSRILEQERIIEEEGSGVSDSASGSFENTEEDSEPTSTSSEKAQEDLEMNEAEMIKDLEMCYNYQSSGKDAVILLRQLVEAVPYMETPSICLDGFVKLAGLKDKSSVYSMLAIILIVSEFEGDVPDFFEKLHDLLRPALFEECEDEMIVLCDKSLRSELLSLNTVRSMVKRLCWIAVRVNTVCCARVLSIVSKTLLRHKQAVVLYKDRKNTENTAEFGTYQPYLFELDALKDHPVLGDYAKNIKSGIPIGSVSKEDIIKRVTDIISMR